MTSKKKTLILTRKVFINKRTGQASIVLPKKKLEEFFVKKIPKKLGIVIKEVKW